jgi:hypothetical protein
MDVLRESRLELPSSDKEVLELIGVATPNRVAIGYCVLFSARGSVHGFRNGSSDDRQARFTLSIRLYVLVEPIQPQQDRE